MRTIKLEKLRVHIGVGKSGEEMDRAKKILEQLTGRRPATRPAKRTIKDFGIREGEPIACLVTLRGKPAHDFMKRALDAVNNNLKQSSFDEFGNFAFGIREHIEVPGTKYVPELGIVGLDVMATLERPGYRVKRRKIRTAQIGRRHLVTKQEAIEFMKQNFRVEVV
jgi:large subunit ribosomal protein L5